MKKQPELTPWFSEGVAPKRNGVYQIFPFGRKHVRWSYWNGEMWSYFTDELKHLTPAYQRNATHAYLFSWRGLASDPKAAA